MLTLYLSDDSSSVRVIRKISRPEFYFNVPLMELAEYDCV